MAFSLKFVLLFFAARRLWEMQSSRAHLIVHQPFVKQIPSQRTSQWARGQRESAKKKIRELKAKKKYHLYVFISLQPDSKLFVILNTQLRLFKKI